MEREAAIRLLRALVAAGLRQRESMANAAIRSIAGQAELDEFDAAQQTRRRSAGRLWRSYGGGFSSRSRRASDRALPDFDSPFYAGCMLVRPDDRGIDGMLLVSWRPKTRQGFECRVPHADLAPACEAHKD